MVEPPKGHEIVIKFTNTDCSNFDKRCSGANFVSFLFYYYCKAAVAPRRSAETGAIAIAAAEKL